MAEPRYVWLLWRGDDIHDDTPEAKLLGAHSSEELAQARTARCVDVPGFAEHPEAFEVTRYDVDRDEWTEGYVVVDS
jgi:hypothetical protein